MSVRDLRNIVLLILNLLLIGGSGHCGKSKPLEHETTHSSPKRYLGVFPSGKHGVDFLEHIVDGDGNCAFTVLGVTRSQLVSDLLPLRKDVGSRDFLAAEIRHTYFASEIPPEQVPVSWLPLRQAYDEAWDRLESMMSAVKAKIDVPYPESLELGERVSWLLESTTRRGAHRNLADAYEIYEEVNSRVESYVRKSDIFKHYLKLYLPPHNLWMGCNTALLWARRKGIDLHIWREKNEQKGVLELVHRVPSHSGKQPVHMLHTSGFIHFNLLEIIAKRNLSLERRQIRRWNRTGVEFPVELTLFDLFVRQMRATSEAIGVASPTRSLTYEEIYLRANKIGRALLEKGAKPNRLIGVFMSKGWEQVVGCLGILASGAAFLPVDPEWPDQRISKVLKSGKVRLLLTQQHLTDRLEGSELLSSYRFLPVDSDEVWAPYSDTPIPLPRSSENIAYVIFTSGSTGEPKGVVIDHIGAVNTILDINRRFKVSSEDRVFGLSKLTFDLSIYDIFGMLAAGGAIVFPEASESKNPSSWVSHIVQDKITIWNSVPMLMEMLVEYVASSRCVEDLRHSLRLTLLSGDWIPLDLPERIATHFTSSEVISLGGATEGSIWSIIYPILEMDPTWKSIPYGLPMANQKMYVLDARLGHCPMGVKGDIYIGGKGVAQGYWRDRKRTRERFIFHPKTEERLYKTGDLGRWNSAGYMEFLGREDNQVKIGGFRIELGDIEEVLNQSPAVKHGIATVTDIGRDQRLVAYVVPDSNFLDDLDEKHLMDWQKVYEDVYEEPTPDLTSNFSGWISSYTGEPIPLVEMGEWLHQTVKRILIHKPRRVLEIGCGSGLLMSRVATLCEAYTATDISLNAIRLVERLKRTEPELEHVEVFHRPAHDFSGFSASDFDMIILNSVVQYFPHRRYFEEVVRNGLEILSPGGVFFIGDVRNYSLLKAFHVSVAASKFESPPSREFLLRHLHMRAAKEEEFHISPHYFFQLRRQFPEIQYVQTQLKNGPSLNELTKFRFDTVLVKGGGADQGVTGEIQPWFGVKNRWNEELQAWLDRFKHPVEALTLEGIPSRRLAYEKSLLEWLNGRVGDVQDVKEPGYPDPQDFIEAAERLGVRVELTTHRSDPYSYDATFIRTVPGSGPLFIEDDGTVQSVSLEPTNCPSLERNRPQLMSLLSAHCRSLLPLYMIPSSYVFIEHLPLSANGKVDRKALPPLPLHKQEDRETPTRLLDRRMAKIWQEVLGVSDISMTDDFFDLGGNSLLAVQALVRANEAFGCDLPISSLFTNSTLKGFCSLFTQKEKHEGRAFMGFNTSGTRVPIFFVHSGRGGAEAYVDLAHHFEEDQPIYAINSHNLINPTHFLTSIEDMAQEYLGIVRALQATGPYFLGGWSMGGVIAYEMAQLLQRLGEEVKALYLLDAILFTGFERKRLRSGVRAFTERDPFYSSLPSPYREHVQEVDCVQTNALLDYKAEPYEGSVVLIKPEEFWSYLDLTPDYEGSWIVQKFMHRIFSKKYNGWEKLTPNLRVHTVTGNHLSIMEGSHSKHMALIIQHDCYERQKGRRPEGGEMVEEGGCCCLQ